MTQSERDALNAEYAFKCRGWTEDPAGLCYDHIPDFLSSDAEFGRQVKALWRKYPETLLSRWQGRPEFGVKFSESTQLYGGDDEHIAATRACIALKVQVPG